MFNKFLFFISLWSLINLIFLFKIIFNQLVSLSYTIMHSFNLTITSIISSSISRLNGISLLLEILYILFCLNLFISNLIFIYNFWYEYILLSYRTFIIWWILPIKRSLFHLKSCLSLINKRCSILLVFGWIRIALKGCLGLVYLMMKRWLDDYRLKFLALIGFWRLRLRW